MEPRKPACILCRGVKLKCVNDNDLTTRCQRCRRLDLPCAYSKRRRRVKAGNPKILPAPTPEARAAAAAAAPSAGSDPSRPSPLPSTLQAGPRSAGGSSSGARVSSSPMDHDPHGQQQPRPHHMRGPAPPHVMHPSQAPPQAPPPHVLPNHIQPPPQRPQQDWGAHYSSPGPPSAAYVSPGNGGGSSHSQRSSELGVSPAVPSPLGPGPSPDRGVYNSYAPQPTHARTHSHGQLEAPPYVQGYSAKNEQRGMYETAPYHEPPQHVQQQQQQQQQQQPRGVKRQQDGPHLTKRDDERSSPPPDANELPFMSASSGNQDSRGRKSMLDDPIHTGYLNEVEAHRLVDLFHQYLNPMIALLDPQLHTSNYLRDGSSILFSAVLAATAQFFHKECYPRLLAHAQKLISTATEHGTCNIGLVQALLILVYWKQPTDQSAWIKIGMAIRLGYQLGWHQRASKSPVQELPSGELEQREQLNEERSWFCLAAFDRTYASVFNLPNAIKAHELSDVEQWIADHQHLDIINDLRLACSIETLFFVDGIRAFKAASKTMSKAHALVQLESLYERGTRLYAKWCTRDEGLPRKLDARERCFLVLYHRSLLFGLRVQMLDFVPPAEVELVLAECLDRAVSYVEALQVVADEGIWQFQQDIASAKLAQFCGTMQELFWRSSNPQRRIVIGVLRTIHQICNKVSDGSPEAPSGFVARFLERLLANLNHASRRYASPEREGQHPGHGHERERGHERGHEQGYGRGHGLPIAQGQEGFMGSAAPPQVDGPVLADLSEFLDTSVLDPSMAAFDEAYWNALFASLPYNLDDLVSL